MSGSGLRLLACLLPAALTACQTLDPAPDIGVPLPEDWTVAASNASPDGWLENFAAPELKKLVHEALAANPDLAAVAARLDQARARTRIAAADRLPAIEADANASRRQSAGESRLGSFRPGRRDNFDLGLATQWEIDLWGRLADQHAASRLLESAAAADLQAARLSLAANVAKAWVGLIEARRQVELARRSTESFSAALSSVERQFDRGLQGDSGGVDVSLSRAALASSRAALAERQQELDSATRALEVLLGRYPAGVARSDSQLPRLRGRIPAGLPSELLLRRPDLLAAARRHSAELRRHSAARKALLPAFRLTGSTGYTSSELRNLLDPTQLIWSIAAGLTQPVFEGGALRAGARLSEARARELAAEYASAALTALAEVESALAAEQFLDQRLDALREAAHSAQEAQELALERFGRGQVPFLSLLEAQRRAFDTQAALIRAEATRLQNRIDLHLALGGGF